MRLLTTVAGVFVLGVAGCAAKPAATRPAVSSQKPGMSSAWQTVAVPSNATSMAVKEGAAPLVYRVEGGATIRVQEVGSKRDLARAFVAGGSLVRVDGRRGVIYGDATVFAGPLSQNGRYIVFVEPRGENVARQGLIQPRPRDAR